MYLITKKLNWAKIFLAAFLFLIISFVTRQVEALITMKYYLMPEYFSVWSKLMMPTAGPPPPSFFITSILFTFLSGLVLAGGYELVKSILPKKFWQRAFSYTEIIVILTLVLGYLPMYLTINLPLALIISWFVSGAIVVFLGSVVFVKILK